MNLNKFDTLQNNLLIFLSRLFCILNNEVKSKIYCGALENQAGKF